MMKVEDKKKAAAEKPRFSKEQLVTSKRFANRRDALRVVLHDNKQYTIEEAQGLIEKFLKGKVN